MPTINLVFVGDSVFTTHDGTSFVDELEALLSGVATVTVTDFSVAGQTLEQQIALYASQPGAAYDGEFDRNICVIHHGSNDLLANISLADWQAAAQDIVDSLTATGYEVITTEAYQWDFDAFGGFVFNTESDWNAYNNTVNSLAGISAVIDTSEIPELTNQANVNNAPYYVDQEHLSATGAELWADYAAPIVSDLITGPGMALTRTNISSTKVEGAGGNSITSASFTPPNNCLLVAVFGAVNAPVAGTPTVSGGGLTWTRRINLGPDYYGGSPPEYHLITEVWTAPVTTGSSMTVTASGGGASPIAGYKILDLFAYVGYDTGSPIGATVTRNNVGDTGALNLTLSGAPAATSEVLAGRGRFDNEVYNTTATPGSGWTELYDTQTSGGFNDLQVQARTGSTSTTVAWADVDDVGGSSSAAFHSFALEIKAAVGGSTTPQSVNATCAGAVSMARRTGKRIAATAAGAVTVRKAVSKVVAVTSAGAVTARKAVAKAVAAASAGAVTVRKAVAKAVVVAAATSTTAAAIKVILKTVSVASAGTVTMTRQTGKRVAVTAAGAVSMTRQTAKSVAATCAGAVNLTKSVAKRVAVACAGAVLIATNSSQTFNQTVDAVCAAAVTVRKAVTKGVAATCAGAPSIVRQVAKRVAASCAGAVSVGAIKVKIVVIAVACMSAVGAARKAVAKGVAVTATGSVTATKAVSFHIAATCAGAVTAIKSVAKRVAVVAASSVTISAIKVKIVTVAVACATSVGAIRKAVNKAVAVAATGSGSIRNVVTFRLAVACSGAVTTAKGMAKRIATTCTTVATVLAQFLGLSSILRGISVTLRTAAAAITTKTAGANVETKTAAIDVEITG